MTDLRDQLVQAYADDRFTMAESDLRGWVTRRRRRRMATAAVLASVVAVGVAIQVNGGDPVQTADSGESIINLDTLPRGAPPAVPWFRAGLIHDGDREIPIRTDGDEKVVGFVPVAGGYAVDIHHSGDLGRQILIDENGATVRTLPMNPHVSPDDETLTWLEVPAGGGSDNRELVTADARTGEVQHRLTVSGSGLGYPVGFLRGGRVVFNTSDGAAIWDPETGDVARAAGIGSAIHTNGVNLIATDTENPCESVVDAERNFAPAWTHCDGLTLPVFTRDSDYALTSAHYDEEHYSVRLIDENTGKTVLDFGQTPIGEAAVAEPDGALLFRLEHPTRELIGIVRCYPSGDCELASELMPPSTTLLLPSAGRR